MEMAATLQGVRAQLAASERLAQALEAAADAATRATSSQLATAHTLRERVVVLEAESESQRQRAAHGIARAKAARSTTKLELATVLPAARAMLGPDVVDESPRESARAKLDARMEARLRQAIALVEETGREVESLRQQLHDGVSGTDEADALRAELAATQRALAAAECCIAETMTDAESQRRQNARLAASISLLQSSLTKPTRSQVTFHRPSSDLAHDPRPVAKVATLQGRERPLRRAPVIAPSRRAPAPGP